LGACGAGFVGALGGGAFVAVVPIVEAFLASDGGWGFGFGGEAARKDVGALHRRCDGERSRSSKFEET
jgi:hypothetical protein